MNIPNKVLKSNSSSYIHQQSLAKKYYKLLTKSKNQKVEPTINPEEVLKWFFSLDLNLRFRICAIENKWLINIVYQMCKHTVFDERIKFQIKTNYNTDEDEVYPIICTNGNQNFINVNLNNFNAVMMDTNAVNNYLNYFYPTSQIQTNINLEKFLTINDKTQKDFFKEIRFFKNEEINDTICLSLKLLDDEDLFKHIFSYFTNGKFFTGTINHIYDQKNKFYNFSFPQWVNQKDFFSYFQWMVAFFEQSILIWYTFSKKLEKKTFDILIYDQKILQILDSYHKIIEFLKKEEFSKKSDKKHFLDQIDFKSIKIELMKDEKISEIICMRKKYVETVYNYCNSNLLYFQHVDKRNTIDIIEDAEAKIKECFYKHEEGLFAEFLFFSATERLFLYDDYLCKRVWEEIHNIFTNKNAHDLIEEALLSEEKKVKSSKKLKKKRNSKDKENENGMIAEILGNIISSVVESKARKTSMIQPSPISNKTLMTKVKPEKRKFFLYNTNTSKRKESAKSEKTNSPNIERVALVQTETNPYIKQKDLQAEINNLEIEDKICIDIQPSNLQSRNQENNCNSPNASKTDNNLKPQSDYKCRSSDDIISVPPTNQNINITINSPVYNNFYIINNHPQMRKLNAPSNNRNNHMINPLNSFNYPNCLSHDVLKKFSQINILHNELLNFAKNVTENTSALKDIKISIINKIEQYIKLNLNDYEISFSIYGSFATDLAIESSDVDITVNYFSNNEESYSMITEIVINKIVKVLNSLKIFDHINPIYTATVPVIKLQIDLDKAMGDEERIHFENFKNSINYKEYPHDPSELDKLRVDLTFQKYSKNQHELLNNYGMDNPAQQVVEYIKNSIVCFPEIKFLILLIKRILQFVKLNSSYNGGLSSYCLFMLVLAFLKMRKLSLNIMMVVPNLGNTLIEFLEFYSNFNYEMNIVDVNSYNPFVFVKEPLEQVPMILDPITYLNAGKTSFRINGIKECFFNILSFVYSYEGLDIIGALFNFFKEKEVNLA